jgi:FkbM family methyltransferase
MRRLEISVRAILINIQGGLATMADAPSMARWVIDVLLYRVLAIRSFGGQRLRTVRFRDGGEITYRLNRGDIRAVAETWMTRAYELPFEVPSPRLIVDFGANIGVTATWLALRYGCERVVAVEPVSENATLARRNLCRNGIRAEVHEGVIGATGDVAHFAASQDSTVGRIAEEGLEVMVLSPDQLIGENEVGLMKIDIEGAEFELLNGAPAWLDRVQLVVAELHPQFADISRVVRAMNDAGFQYERLPIDHIGPKGVEFMASFRRVPTR